MTNRTPTHRPARAIACTVLVGSITAAAVLLPRPGMSQSFQTIVTPQVQLVADTGTKRVSDSTLSASLAATRDTLATLRRLTHREPGVVYHATIRNGRTSVSPATGTSAAVDPRTGLSIATVQAAIASRFPDAAAATPDHKRVFAFIVDSAGQIQQAHVDTSVARADTSAVSAARGVGRAIHAFTGIGNPANFSSIEIRKHVPLGSDSVSVVWLVQK